MHIAYPSSYPYGFAPGHKLQKPSKESGVLHSLGTNNVVLVYQKTELKRGEAGTIAPLLNTLLRAGFRQLEALSYLITLIETEKVFTSSDVLFSLKISV